MNAIFRPLLSVVVAWSLFSRPDPDVAEGNRLYQEGQYKQALEQYDKAKVEKPEQARRLAFNRGTAQLKLGDYEAAKHSFREVEADADPQLRARAAYNRGNASMLLKDLPGAVEAYRHALMDRPDYSAARHNLELALRAMRRPDAGQPDAGQPEAGPQDAGSGDGVGDGGDQHQGDGGVGDGGDQHQGDGGVGDGGQSQNAADAGNGAGQDAAAQPQGRDGGDQAEAGGANSQPKPQEPEEAPKDMSKQEALRLLDSLRDSERDQMLMRFLQQEQAAPRAQVEKNW